MKFSARTVIAFTLVFATLARAQVVNPEGWSPPPMVPASPPPVPPPEPGAQNAPPPTPALEGTPPPPGAPPPSRYLPGANPSGYPYSPYGTPLGKDEKPPVEYGLMISESLFGMLTAAGVSLIPYFLLFRTGATLGDPTISSVIFILIFSAVPLAVSQTEISLANGSRHYVSESWPAALTGLAIQAGVLGLYYATGWLPQASSGTGAPQQAGSEALLLIGTVALVPLAEMAVINVFKSPRQGRVALAHSQRPAMFSLSAPSPMPIVGQTRAGASLGMGISFLNGRF